MAMEDITFGVIHLIIMEVIMAFMDIRHFGILDTLGATHLIIMVVIILFAAGIAHIITTADTTVVITMG